MQEPEKENGGVSVASNKPPLPPGWAERGTARRLLSELGQNPSVAAVQGANKILGFRANDTKQRSINRLQRAAAIEGGEMRSPPTERGKTSQHVPRSVDGDAASTGRSRRALFEPLPDDVLLSPLTAGLRALGGLGDALPFRLPTEEELRQKACGVTDLHRSSAVIASTLFNDLEEFGSWDDLLGAVMPPTHPPLTRHLAPCGA